MATDNPRKPTRRKPTKRPAARRTTSVDAHYSKLTRTSTPESASRRRESRAEGQAQQRPAEHDEEPFSPSQQPANAQRRPVRRAVPSRERKTQRAPHASGYQSLSRGTQQRVYGSRSPRRQRSGNLAALLVGVAVIAAFVGGAVFFWTHRTVSVTVNGSRERIRIESSLEQLYDKAGIRTKPGDYVSVSGNVIEAEAGYAFAATVDGKELSRKATGEYRIHGGEQITLSDGGDRMEKYDVSYQETQPKLVFEGSWGAVSYVKQWGQAGKREVRTGRESGEKADGDWVDELKDCVIATRNVSPADGKKLVALTFDDGPAATYTEEYLRILKEHGAKATFFNLSENETDHPELAEKVAASGNQICSHTNHHQQLSTLSQADLLSEIGSAHDTILSLTGVDTTIVRPPYGDFDQNCWLMTGGIMSASILWNQDTLDWSMPGSDVIVENALSGIQPGSIILMHDGGGDRSQDLEALPQIIERLQQDGYTLVTLSELLASDPEIPAEIAQGNAQMPEGAVWPTEIGEASTEVG